MWSRISQGKSSPTQFSNVFKSSYDHMWDGKGQFTIKALCSWLLPHLRTGMRDNQSINQSQNILSTETPSVTVGVTHFHTRQVEWKSSPDSISSVLNEVQPALIISSSASSPTDLLQQHQHFWKELGLQCLREPPTQTHRTDTQAPLNLLLWVSQGPVPSGTLVLVLPSLLSPTGAFFHHCSRV